TTQTQVLSPSEDLGHATGITLSDFVSHATTQVDGALTALGGDVQIHAASVNTRNQSVTNVVVRTPPAANVVEEKLAELQAELLGPYSAGQLGMSAAVVLVTSENTARAALGSPARIAADGAASVTSYAEDNFRALAVGGSHAGAEFSIGGALVITEYANQAETLIGDGATLNAKGTLTASSQAVGPQQVDPDGDWDRFLATQPPPLPALRPLAPDNTLPFFGELFDFGTKGVKGAVDSLSALAPYIRRQMTNPDAHATTYALGTAGLTDKGTPSPDFALSGTMTL